MTAKEFWRERRVLTICQRGNNRSVALGWMLKDELGAEALCVGVETATRRTMQMLCEWAETIVLVDERLIDGVPQEYRSKLLVWDVGPDVYFSGFNHRLVAQYEQFFRQHETVLH